MLLEQDWSKRSCGPEPFGPAENVQEGSPGLVPLLQQRSVGTWTWALRKPGYYFRLAGGITLFMRR